MAKLIRKMQKIFAGTATNNGQFGSAKTGAKVTSTDLDILQALPAFNTGWLDAIISGRNLPALEEMQSLQYITTRQIAYLFQEGLAEYDSGTTYYQNSIVKKAGTYQLYGSLVDDNTGNPLTDGTKWVLLIDLGAASSAETGSIITFAGTTAPSGYLECNGAALNRTTYNKLFTAIGTTWGSGDGSTTFNIPDTYSAGRFLRSRTATNAVGLAQNDAYLNHSHTASSNTTGSHTHSITVTDGTNIAPNGPYITARGNTIDATPTRSTNSDGSHSHTVTVDNSTTGNTETRPKNLTMMFCIKY